MHKRGRIGELLLVPEMPGCSVRVPVVPEQSELENAAGKPVAVIRVFLGGSFCPANDFFDIYLFLFILNLTKIGQFLIAFLINKKKIISLVSFIFFLVILNLAKIGRF